MTQKDKFQYQHEQLIGQLIKFSPSFAHFNFLVFTVGGIFKLSL